MNKAAVCLLGAVGGIFIGLGAGFAIWGARKPLVIEEKDPAGEKKDTTGLGNTSANPDRFSPFPVGRKFKKGEPIWVKNSSASLRSSAATANNSNVVKILAMGQPVGRYERAYNNSISIVNIPAAGNKTLPVYVETHTITNVMPGERTLGACGCGQ